MRGLAIVVLCAAGIAHADSPAAREAYERGVKLYRADDFARAATEFERAYELVPDPAYLFNVAQAHRLAKHCTEAFEAYGKFLEKMPRASNREEVEGYRKELARCAKTPLTPPSEPDPPQPPPREPVPPPPQRDPPAPVQLDRSPGMSAARIAGIVAVGVGALALGGGIYYAAEGRSLENERTDLWKREPYDELRDRRFAADGKRANQRAVVGLVAGGALVTGGAVLIWLGGTSSEKRPMTTVVPITGGVLVTRAIRF